MHHRMRISMWISLLTKLNQNVPHGQLSPTLEMIYELRMGNYIVKSVSETLKLNLLVTSKVFSMAAGVMWCIYKFLECCFKWSQLQFVWFVILFWTLGGVWIAGWIRPTVLSPTVWVNMEAWTVVKGACTCPNLVSPSLTTRSGVEQH